MPTASIRRGGGDSGRRTHGISHGLGTRGPTRTRKRGGFGIGGRQSATDTESESDPVVSQSVIIPMIGLRGYSYSRRRADGVAAR